MVLFLKVTGWNGGLTGATELMRTPLAAHSIASDLVKLSTPARAAPEWLQTELIII